MKPLMLSGHTRSLTQVEYNLDGDLLFSCAKDSKPMVWYSHNGERIGTYEGHNGTVWSLNTTYDTRRLITGSADNSAKIWDVETGKELVTMTTKSAVRTSKWSYSGEQFFYSTDQNMGQKCELRVFNTKDVLAGGEAAPPTLTIHSPESKITSALWGVLDETIITGHENGGITKWNAKTGEIVGRVKKHTDKINDLQFNKTQSTFITGSKDCAAKLFDTDTLEVLKEYKTERPVNSAAISPLKDHVLLGGGQDAMSVTTTAGKVGKFDARFYHMVFMEELGRVKGHFGPINYVTFNPDGCSYASGGEDGYIRVHNFDPSYFEFEFEH